MIFSSSASGHIIAVISTNVTDSQAETILRMLTHNSTDARVGNKKTMNDYDLHNTGIEPTMISQGTS